MTEAIPYYERTLDSFADYIITRARLRNDGGWHAVLDCGFRTYVSDPDFSPYGYGKDAAEAHARSAKAIRDNAKGIGKNAPTSILTDSYDLHFRLMKHWDRKERFDTVGIDPNEMIIAAANVDWKTWALDGSLLACNENNRVIEFAYLLIVAETSAAVRAGQLNVDEAEQTILDAVQEEFADSRFVARPTADTWNNLDRRIDQVLTELASSLAAPKI